MPNGLAATRRCSRSPAVRPAPGQTLWLGMSADAGWELAPGSFAAWRWLAPPGSRLVEVSASNSTMLFNGLVERIGSLGAAGAFDSLAEISGYNLGVVSRVEVGFPARSAFGFEQRVLCAESTAGSCRTTFSWAELFELQLRLEDLAAPTAALSGDLAASGWRRGAVAGTVAAGDDGSGVRRTEAQVDGTGVAGGDLACETTHADGRLVGARMRPCPATASLPVAIDLTALPDGPHELRACAIDFAGAAGCSQPTPLLVDNTPPLVSFDPAGTLRAGRISAEVSDPASGPTSGSISYRDAAGSGPWTNLTTELRRTGDGAAVLSANAPGLAADGRLLLRAEARDGAGNLGSSVIRAASDGSASGADGRGGRDGRGSGSGDHVDHGGRGHRGTERATRLRAWFDGGSEGRTAVRTVGFGQPAIVRGRLTDAAGRALGGERVRVASRPARGALARPATQVSTTARDGRFEVRLGPGTSRAVVVSFAGGDGNAASRTRPLQLRVRTGVTLRVEPTRLRTGEVIHLSGRVRHAGAGVPDPGVLVAIQYLEKAARRWRPVLVARSDGQGDFAARYRFRYVTGRASIRLRGAVLPEERWPFAAGASRPVTVESTAE